MDKMINISFVSDEGYVKYMIVAIESMILNLVNKTNINFYILDTGITENSKSKLQKRYKDNADIKIIFIDINTSELNEYKLKTHVSTAAFSKIYIADLVDVDKIIYLDCDLMMNADINMLWEEFEDGVPLKAVWNPFYNYDSKYMGLTEDARTFNSGVMLLDLELLRSMNASKRLLDFLNEYNDKTKLHDQAAFNAVFKNDWQELDYKWNYQVSMILSNYRNLEISQNHYFKLFKNPYIIHFTSNSKPWQYRNSHPYKKKFLYYYSDIFNEKQDVDNLILDSLKKIREIFRYMRINVINHL